MHKTMITIVIYVREIFVPKAPWYRRDMLSTIYIPCCTTFRPSMKYLVRKCFSRLTQHPQIGPATVYVQTQFVSCFPFLKSIPLHCLKPIFCLGLSFSAAILWRFLRISDFHIWEGFIGVFWGQVKVRQSEHVSCGTLEDKKRRLLGDGSTTVVELPICYTEDRQHCTVRQTATGRSRRHLSNVQILICLGHR
jgi:hypothetical protein